MRNGPIVSPDRLQAPTAPDRQSETGTAETARGTGSSRYSKASGLYEICDLPRNGCRVLLDSQLREDGFQIGRGHQCAQTFDGIIGNDSAAMQDHDTRCHALNGFEFV